MKKIKQLISLCAIAFAPVVAFSQTVKYDKFNYKPLSSEQNVNAKFQDNYNKGVEHYNKAVLVIKTIKPEATSKELEDAQIKASVELKQALPHFKICYEINPKDKKVLEGLCGTSFGMNDTENVKKYKSELDAVNAAK